MTMYEQIWAEQRAATAALDRIYQPLDYAVMRVDVAPRAKRIAGQCAVRVQKPIVPVASDAVMRSAQTVRQSKDRGS